MVLQAAIKAGLNMAISFSKQTSNTSTLEIQIYFQPHGYLVVHIVYHRTTTPTTTTTTNPSFLAGFNPLSTSLTPSSHCAYTSTSLPLTPPAPPPPPPPLTFPPFPPFHRSPPFIPSPPPPPQPLQPPDTTPPPPSRPPLAVLAVLGILTLTGGLAVVLGIAHYIRPRSEEENPERLSQPENSNGRVPEPYELGGVTVRRESNRVAVLPEPIKSPTPALRVSVYK